MRYFLVLMVIIMAGCRLPGVGELEERVDDLETTAVYDDSDLKERLDYVEEEIVILGMRVTAIETGGVAEIPNEPHEGTAPVQVQEPLTPPAEPSVIGLEDVNGLNESLEELWTAMDDSIASLDGDITEMDGSMEGLLLQVDTLNLRIDSLESLNDSLGVQLEDLEETVQNLSYTVQNLRNASSSSSSGGRGSTSSSTGTRGGTSSSTSSSSSSSGGR
ncbi:MAG: hypothetical protein AVO35_12260 [Candidatus Aegiribacteria sp. MLS_C]|nr:MAG: hypothetical protein AVO35_12260 [Candidatus Aegiribacteria sp. MLS_C]